MGKQNPEQAAREQSDRMLRNHIASSFHLERADLEYVPFDEKGGLGKVWKSFGEGMDELINKMNEALVA